MPSLHIDPSGESWWSGIVIGVGSVAGIIGGVLVAITTPVWVTVVGVVVTVVAIVVVVNEIRNIWPAAKRIVKPIEPGVRRRNRQVDLLMDDAGFGR